MGLHGNQLGLLWHLAQYVLLDYESCLKMLETEVITDRTALSYAFRPLTKNGYVDKRPDGSVKITAKGRKLFPELEPLLSVGGKGTEKRVMEVSRMAMWMWRQGFPSLGEVPAGSGIWFIPSACWRKISPGILSTTRFTGMLVGCGQKLAVYNVDDGHMEWQVRAEGSLFNTKYGSYETKATGMLFVTREDKLDEVARNIVRQTIWQRRQIAKSKRSERNKPTRWSQAPIKLKPEYEHVYLTTPQEIRRTIISILCENKIIDGLCGKSGTRLGEQNQADIEIWPRRLFVNPASDLLKYVCFFGMVKDSLHLVDPENWYGRQIRYELYAPSKDKAIIEMYQDVNAAKEVSLFLSP